MSGINASWIRRRNGRRLLGCLLGVTLLAPVAMFADKKKKADASKPPPVIDYSNIVWPNPPAIARIRYQAFYAAEKISQVEAENSTKKAKWMDRLAGTGTGERTRRFFSSWSSRTVWRWTRRTTCTWPTRRLVRSSSSIQKRAKWS